MLRSLISLIIILVFSTSAFASDSINVTVKNFTYDEYHIESGKLRMGDIETIYNKLGFGLSNDTLRVFHRVEILDSIGDAKVTLISENNKGVLVRFSDFKEAQKRAFVTSNGNFYYDNVPRGSKWGKLLIGIRDDVYYYKGSITSDDVSALIKRYLEEGNYLSPGL